jgi:ornithine cyclodeaminase
MPASLDDPPSVGAKLVTLFHSNTARRIPTHLASIVLLDHETGAIRALIDGRYITEARTAAVSAVSARLLAREQAETLAILGTGVQARSHLEAIPCVRRIRKVRVWSPTPASRERFVQRLGGARRARRRHCRDGDGRGPARPDGRLGQAGRARHRRGRVQADPA